MKHKSDRHEWSRSGQVKYDRVFARNIIIVDAGCRSSFMWSIAFDMLHQSVLLMRRTADGCATSKPPIIESVGVSRVSTGDKQP